MRRVSTLVPRYTHAAAMGGRDSMLVYRASSHIASRRCNVFISLSQPLLTGPITPIDFLPSSRRCRRRLDPRHINVPAESASRILRCSTSRSTLPSFDVTLHLYYFLTRNEYKVRFYIKLKFHRAWQSNIKLECN